MVNTNNIFDIQFNDSENSNNKGFSESLDFCKNYIATHNGTNESYFKDYKNGTVSIINTVTNEVVQEEKVK